MASKLTEVEPTKRVHSIEGYEVNIVMDADGLHIQKKGDKHREKPTIHVSWTDLMEIGADKQKERGELGDANGAYDFLGLE